MNCFLMELEAAGSGVHYAASTWFTNRGKIAIAVCAPSIAKAEVVNLEAEGYERTNP